jgi:hypothetical protein
MRIDDNGCQRVGPEGPTLLVLHIEVEVQADITSSFDVESVPHFILLRVYPPLLHIRPPSCVRVPV